MTVRQRIPILQNIGDEESPVCVGGELAVNIDLASYLGSFATQATMLAVTGASIGDWCNRSDLDLTWVLTALPSTSPVNWAPLSLASGLPPVR